MIRSSHNNENAAVCRLHKQAFGEPEGAVIAQLVAELFNDLTAQPLLSLVAEEDGLLTGHVLFSALRVAEVSAAIMAPLAVHPDYQHKGIGTALVEYGIERLRDQGRPFVMVLGDPGYYTRFGFNTAHAIAAPHPLPYPEAWLALELEPGALDGLNGSAVCATALMVPEHW